MLRKKTNVVQVGGVAIGGGHPIAIQSMCNTDTRDVKATVAQIHELEQAGCELIRVAIPDMVAAKAIGAIKNEISIPLVGDIHFDYRLALTAMEQGVDKIRINPGNIGDEAHTKAVVEMAKAKKIPLRIGVNNGSLEPKIIEKYGGNTPEGLVESAMNHVRLLEKYDFHNIAISLKASDIAYTLEAYRRLSEQVSYPLHIGITEAGTQFGGTIKSAVGIGILLSEGLGDTLRVSLTADPVEEIYVAKEILKSLGLRNFGVTLVSCPTCGRTEVDLIPIAEAVEAHCKSLKKNIKVAVMGCAVNGPGEARDADVGIACGKGEGLLFKKGEIVMKLKEEELLGVLLKEIDAM
ncbi:MAG: flavodoxin-dependent (E)-4-hydroxy-3-methylbut-2-enyl-diphosphate synthase [Bacillota bacterium]